MTCGEALQWARETLAAASVECAESDADWLLCDLLHISRATLPLHRAAPLSDAKAEQLRDYVQRRCAGEPLQYILGTQPFYGRLFHVDPRVLIPRPETELLCEHALNTLADSGIPHPKVLDLCTGSGCLAVSIALECPNAQVTASDISGEALTVAHNNAESLGAAVHFSQGDLFAPHEGRRYDLIVCNPPYIPHVELATLSVEVQGEPTLALDGGTDGLNFYRRIALGAPKVLNRPGTLLLEVGHDQAQDVVSLLQAQGAQTHIDYDLQHIARFVQATWREEDNP